MFGEHAVLYGKTSVACAIAKYATAVVKRESTDRNGNFVISLGDFSDSYGRSLEYAISTKHLKKMYKDYSESQLEKYIKDNDDKKVFLPFLTIAARLQSKGVELGGLHITLKSEIPMQRGMASSAACSTAFAVSLIRCSNIKIAEEEIIDIARDGERVSHASAKAGGIDVTTSFYGGYISYSTSNGVKVEDLDMDINPLIIDTGPKKNTLEMVKIVGEFVKNNPEAAVKIMNDIDSISHNGIKMLKKRSIKDVGILMYENQECLKVLGVSTPKIDKIVDLAKKSDAFGAKISGGGGGGIIIVIPNLNNEDKLIKSIIPEHVEIIKSTISKEGAKGYLSENSD